MFRFCESCCNGTEFLVLECLEERVMSHSLSDDRSTTSGLIFLMSGVDASIPPEQLDAEFDSFSVR